LVLVQRKPNYGDERARLVKTFNLLGEVRIGLLELVDEAAEPTSSIASSMAERIYQEQARVMAVMRAKKGRSDG
jgi:hypothetical protein